jgi:hypothetical protein
LREISVPSTLSEKLGQFVVDHSASTLSTTTTTTPGYSDFDEYGFNGSTDGSYTLPCNPGVPPLSNTPSYSGANYSYSRSTVFDVVESSQGAGGFTPGYFIGTYTVSSGTSVATALSYNDTDVTNYSGLSSYEKVPVTKFNSYDGMLFSPGIYYVLDHPELSVSGTLTPEAVKLLYLQELSPKKVSLDMIYVSVEDPPTDYLRFDYYKADTLPYDYDLSGVTPKANNKAKFIDKNYAVEDGHTFYFVGCWDCGRPAYCREQLLSLGFTEEDLTP